MTISLSLVQPHLKEEGGVLGLVDGVSLHLSALDP